MLESLNESEENSDEDYETEEIKWVNDNIIN